MFGSSVQILFLLKSMSKQKGTTLSDYSLFIFIFPFDCFALRERFTALRSLSSEAYRRGFLFAVFNIRLCSGQTCDWNAVW